MMSQCEFINISCPINRYEDEINKRAAVENEFVLLKKVMTIQHFIFCLLLLLG